ncbi:hypothetical protein B484DRAFT_170353 [Ochromonadaceae sp. CCMP2298]|nr:hypothetical protein B484DRAFT_170353 [Ochromonadaceae sp. CCMP2298]
MYSAVCVLVTVCCVLCAICSVSAVCCVLCAVCFLLCAMCCVLFVVCYVPFAVYCVLCAVCYALYAVRCVLYAVCLVAGCYIQVTGCCKLNGSLLLPSDYPLVCSVFAFQYRVSGVGRVARDESHGYQPGLGVVGSRPQCLDYLQVLQLFHGMDGGWRDGGKRSSG